MNKKVIMYGITYLHKSGLRMLTHPNQNRFFKHKKKDADDHLSAMIENNSADTIKSLFGENPEFKVMPIEMWCKDGDAKREVF